ncbi:GNAT family N-acetyltransferase [Desemzia sp. C1]|uniref:GNAT family N-acetyltransferase n=1 Tax=Desemzia sp. C1 TaxID=2892016 RepID=UPI001E318A81|nr:GNAT family N-acetyltransferase [Desemzia sp. C1]MCI3027977.1 GNAT family N-acetyltransferase [Desemzia sp. C1]
MNYSIKPFEMKDLPFLWEMLYQSIYVPEGQKVPSLDILKEPAIEKYLSHWGKEHDHALVAVNENNYPIGAVWIRLLDQENAGYGFVDNNTPELGMAIESSYRGLGVGKNLLSKMIDLAEDLRYSAISFNVDPRNKNALRLYENSGFKKEYEDDGGSWTMKKDL